MLDERHMHVIYVSREQSPFREAGGLDVAERIGHALQHSGFSVAIAEFSSDYVHHLGNDPTCRVVFNLVYGFVDRSHARSYSQSETTYLMEKAGLFPIGSSARVQEIAQDKLHCGQ